MQSYPTSKSGSSGRFVSFIAGLVVLLQLTGISESYSQTKGVIFQKPPTGSPQVLDLNGNGYVSQSSTGFTVGNDMGTNSEITFRFFPQMPNPKGPEPLSDLATGSGGGHTDLAQYPLAMYYDGTNVLFRVRLGGSSTASKGYSFLIDTDGVFNKVKLANGTLVDYVTPSKVTNLGFEYEVVMAANFDIVIYRHIGSGDNSDPYSSNVIWQGSVQGGGYTKYFQKAVAASESGSDADYFYDFYVPRTAFATDGGPGIDPNTKLRMSGASVTSAQTGLTGTISDIGGVDDKKYGNDKIKIWQDLIAAFPPTSLNDLVNGDFCVTAAPTAPVISTGTVIRVNAASITGTASTTDNGSEIKLYLNGVELVPASTVTIAAGAWNFPIPAGTTLVGGDIISAKVYRAASGNCSAVSSNASNSVTIGASQLGTCALTAPIITGYGANQSRVLGTTIYSGATIKLYRDGQYFGAVTASTSPTGGPYAWSYDGGSAPNQRIFNYDISAAGSSALVNNGTIAATVTQTGCESKRSAPSYLAGNSELTTPNTGTSATPNITNTFICSATTTLSGTAAANSLVYLFVNGQPTKTQTTNATDTQSTPATSSNSLSNVTTAAAAGTWTIDIAQYGFQTGDVITVKVMTPDATYFSGYKGLSADATINGVVATTSITVSATCPQTTAPVITPAPCASAATITGTISGSEANGTIIYVYRQETAGVFAPATDAQINIYTTAPAGAPTTNWTATIRSGVTLKSGDQLYAVALAPSGKQISANSAAVIVSSPSLAAAVGLTLNATINEGATTISGTSNSAGTVYLYIDGQKISETTTVTTGTSVPWTVNITAANQTNLAAGIGVTASLSTSGGCLETQQTAEVKVTCTAPASKTVSGYTNSVCEGSSDAFTITGSQDGIIYTLKSNTSDRSASVLGDGGNITLTSFPISANETYTVEAIKIGAGNCNPTSTSSMAITANPVPSERTVSAPATINTGNSADVIVQNSQAGYYYQLRNGSTLVGPYKTGTGGNLALPTGVIATETTYNVLVTDPTFSTNCTKQMAQTAKIGMQALPVEMLFFKGRQEKNAVVLEWATATEKNNDHFVVERSQDGKSFEPIGKVRGNQNSNQLHAYSFTDEKAPASVVYYRLKQVDTDGAYDFSNVIVLDRSKASKAEPALVYPNPTSENCALLINSTEAETTSYILFDALGKVVSQEVITVNAGQNILPVQTKGLPAGMYFLNLNGKAIQANLKIQKLNE
jgi:hypothetical protein